MVMNWTHLLLILLDSPFSLLDRLTQLNLKLVKVLLLIQQVQVVTVWKLVLSSLRSRATLLSFSMSCRASRSSSCFSVSYCSI